MPTYDYHCDHCGHAFSATGGFDDPPLSACPRCGEEPRRLIVATAIVFKGSGWYKTDSRAAPKDGDAAAPAPSAGEGAPAADAKPADAKPAGTPSAEGERARSKPAGPRPAAPRSAESGAGGAPAGPSAAATGKPPSSG